MQMAILTGVSDYRQADFELAGANRHILAVLLLILVHGLLWLSWPGLRWQAQTTDREAIEVRWISARQAAPLVAKVATAPATPSQSKKPSRQTTVKAARSAASDTVVAITPPVSTPSKQPDSSLAADPLASAAPVTGLDLEQVRGAARQIGRQQQPDTIAQIQESHRRDQRMETQLGQNVAKAAKKDCLKAYSGIGLLAVIPLAVSTVVDTGCKW